MDYRGKFLVCDLETGGLWAHNNPIIEIAVIVLDAELKELERYENFIKPYNDLKIEPQALQANGINMEEVEEKGIDSKVLYKDLAELFKKHKMGRWKKPILVGHNFATFDKKFLEHLFNLYEKPNKTSHSSLYKYVDEFIFDTLSFIRIKKGLIELPNHQLGTTCELYGIDLIDAHRAMNDTIANKDLFLKMMGEIRESKQIVLESEKTPIKKFREDFYF